MTWTNSEIITASRLEDKADKNKANEYAGIGANQLIDGSIISNFNLLKIANRTNGIFAVNDDGTNKSRVDMFISAGTALLRIQDFDGAIADISESSKFILSSMPQTATFRINQLFFSGTNIRITFGITDATGFNGVGIETRDSGNNWGFFNRINSTALTSTSISAIQSGDVITVIATPTVCSMMKNNNLVAKHTTNIPCSAAIGRYAGMYQGSSAYSSYIEFSFLS